jgi:hypothetical protein
MGSVTSGVYPVFENVFKIGTAGKTSTSTDMETIADLETFSVSFDDNVEEWTPMTTDGWKRRLKTGKAFTIGLSGKRHIGDAGNDYVASLAFVTGQACETVFSWTLPDGTLVEFDALINITSTGGDSTAVDALEFDVQSNGKPTVTVE